MAAQEATVESLWKHYEALKPRERRTLVERILRDQKLAEDWLHHLLIEQAKSVKGKPISLEEYITRRRKARR